MIFFRSGTAFNLPPPSLSGRQVTYLVGNFVFGSLRYDVKMKYNLDGALDKKTAYFKKGCFTRLFFYFTKALQTRVNIYIYIKYLPCYRQNFHLVYYRWYLIFWYDPIQHRISIQSFLMYVQKKSCP